MKAKAFLTAAIVSAACLFSSCENTQEGEPAENFFGEIFAQDGTQTFVRVNKINSGVWEEESDLLLGSEFSGSLDELVSALENASLTEFEEIVSESDENLYNSYIQITAEKNRSDTESYSTIWYSINIETNGGDYEITSFGDRYGNFVWENHAYKISENDYKKILAAAEKVLSEKNSFPQTIYIPDYLSSQLRAGANISPAGFSWSYIDENGKTRGLADDALHPLDENALTVRVQGYSSSVGAYFADGSEPDKITVVGWDAADRGNTSAEPKITAEHFYSTDIGGIAPFDLERKMICRLTVFYDESKLDERGFAGTADYYFET